MSHAMRSLTPGYLLASAMIASGISLLVFAIGSNYQILSAFILDWWYPITGAIITFIVYRRWGLLGAAIAFAVFVIPASIYVLIIWAVQQVQEGIESIRNASTFSFEWRWMVGPIVFIVQMIYLYIKLAWASSEKRTPYKLLNGVVSWTALAAGMLSFVPWDWGYPLVLWSMFLIVVNWIVVGETVTLTTTFVRLTSSGNSSLKAHGDSSIKANLQTLGYGYWFSFAIAIGWTAHNVGWF